MKKVIFIILSGAAGKPCRSLNNKTPLEYAKKPFIDSLFRKSTNGLMNVVGLNITPLSSVALFALLGYNPFKVPARGVIEAVGSGFDYSEGELAVNCTLARVKKGHRNMINRPRLTQEQGLEAERLINEGITLGRPFEFKYLKNDEGVLVIHDELPDRVTDTYPGFIRHRVGPDLMSLPDIKLKECKPLDSQSVETAELINDFVKQSVEVLVNTGAPVNHVFTRGAGNSLPLLKSFDELNDFTVTMISDSALELGVAELLGMKVLSLTNDLPSLIMDSLTSSEGVFLRIKSPDLYGHLGDAAGKARRIEKIDKELFKPLIEMIDLSEHVLCVTSDHATPACFGTHTNNPVPYLITSDVDNTGCFCESNVANSFIEGRQLINEIKRLA
ncbi:hypothetical protein GF352_00470 [archaeon]|nr:hypothetical protein [archaeon]